MNPIYLSLRAIVLTLWITTGLYFGISGYLALLLDDQKKAWAIAPENPRTIENQDYRNIEEWVWEQNKNSVANIFPWLEKVPPIMNPVIAAICFGILGGATRVIKEISFDPEVSLANAKVVSTPVLGMLTGVIMLGVSSLVPALFIAEGTDIRPLTLIFLALFAGLFGVRFYDWLGSLFNTIFPQKPKDQ